MARSNGGHNHELESFFSFTDFFGQMNGFTSLPFHTPRLAHDMATQQESLPLQGSRHRIWMVSVWLQCGKLFKWRCLH